MENTLENALESKSVKQLEERGWLLSAIGKVASVAVLAYAALTCRAAGAQESQDGWNDAGSEVSHSLNESTIKQQEEAERKKKDSQARLQKSEQDYKDTVEYLRQRAGESVVTVFNNYISNEKAKPGFDLLKSIETYKSLNRAIFGQAAEPKADAQALQPAVAAPSAQPVASPVVSAAPVASADPVVASPSEPYDPTGAWAIVGKSLAPETGTGIESTFWGIGFDYFQDSNEVFRALFRANDGELCTDGTPTADYANRLFALRHRNPEGGKYPGFVVELGADLDKITSSFSQQSDPIVSGPLTINQGTSEESAENFDRSWARLFVPMGANGSGLGFVLAGRNYKQESAIVDTVHTEGDVQSSDPNFPNPIHIDRTDVVNTEATAENNAAIYELSFRTAADPTQGGVPVVLRLRAMEGKQSVDLAQTVNGIAQPGSSDSSDYGRALVTVEALSQNPTGNFSGSYMLGINAGDGVQDRNDVLASVMGAFLSENKHFGVGIYGEFIEGANAGLVFVARPSGAEGLDVSGLLELMRYDRESRLPMDPRSPNGEAAIDEHLYPAFVRDGIVVSLNRGWGVAGELGAEAPEDSFSAKAAYCHKGFFIQVGHTQDGDGRSTGAVLGYGNKVGNGDKRLIGFLTYNNCKTENLEGDSFGAGLKVDF